MYGDYCVKHHICYTCQQLCGDFLSKINWVRGDGSSSYLSKGSLSITIGSQSTQENRTMGWAERGGWERGDISRHLAQVWTHVWSSE